MMPLFIFILTAILSLAQYQAYAQTVEVQESPTESVEQRQNCDGTDFEIYKPTYGIIQLGTKDPRTGNIPFIKFQINLTQRFFEKQRRVPVEFDISYTLKALWDIAEDSAPFKDYSHNPEAFLFFYRENWINAKLGLEHESNGKAGADSRSWNKVYIQPRVLLKIPGKGPFHSAGVYLKSWWKFHGDDENNKNITDYYGYGELALKLYGKKWVASATHYRGRKVDIGTTLYEVMYNLRDGLAFYFQYFDGYGETLLDYDKKGERFGLGFSLGTF